MADQSLCRECRLRKPARVDLTRAHLQRQYIPVARCTVEKIIRMPRPSAPVRGTPSTTRSITLMAQAQYTAIHFTEFLMLAGLKPSIGLHKTECIREGSPFRSGLGRRRPAEVEAEYYARLRVR